MAKFLDSCALVEDIAADIYRELAATARAIHDEELSMIWEEMAKDEEDHAHQLRLASRLSRNTIIDESKSNFATDPAALTTRARSFLDMIIAGQLTEREMLDLASELEGDFSALHVSCSLVFRDESLQKMFKALARADNRHVAKLHERIRKLNP